VSQKRVFISYRRSDSAGHAGRLYDYLKNYFGNERIFFDVNTIQAGVNFEQKINSELDNSEVVLVLIGNQWLDAKDKEGSKRLDNPKDYVRLEVETALSKNITVIPILLQGATMPSGNVLPDTLYDLSRRNAIRLNDDHWNSDFKLLATIMENALNVSRSLKERKIRKLRQIVFSLAALGTLLAIGTQLFFADSYNINLIGLVVKLIFVFSVGSIVAVVAYLFGILKQEIDRLGWIIISLAIMGAVFSAWGGGFSLWTALMMVLVAGLVNFIQIDE